MTALHPHLAALADRVFDPTDPALLADADLVFLALPHGESAALSPQLPAELPVVDLGADFRLADAEAWATYYGGPHAGTWTYGLPELPGQRELIAASTRVANTGCYAAAITLALAPLSPPASSAPRTSWSSRRAAPPARAAASRPNLLGQRGHGRAVAPTRSGPTSTSRRSSRRAARRTLSFTPMLAPMPRGILATVTARPTSP